MASNKKCTFMELQSGDIFLDNISGNYFMVTPERWHFDQIVNAIMIDGRTGGNQCAQPVHFDFTDDVFYIGSLGVNWFPEQF